LPPDVPDISEELLLGRTLLEQGHLGAAQRVLVGVCQRNPENAEAFGRLCDILRRKGDGVRARIIGDYAQDLREGSGLEPEAPSQGLKTPTMPPSWKPPSVAGASQSAEVVPRAGAVTPLIELLTPPSESLASSDEII
jgi:hypothetical protein